ncbi:hypothetical protein Bbelb_172270 [Branchiostoma belcheri]|nr:hypothetical protein Bbelb_172270 [Branchiostoma belcheri]
MCTTSEVHKGGLGMHCNQAIGSPETPRGTGRLWRGDGPFPPTITSTCSPNLLLSPPTCLPLETNLSRRRLRLKTDTKEQPLKELDLRRPVLQVSLIGEEHA